MGRKRALARSEHKSNTDAILRSLVLVAEKVGGTPTCEQYIEVQRQLAAEGVDVKPAHKLVRHFGSWRMAKEALSLVDVNSGHGRPTPTYTEASARANADTPPPTHHLRPLDFQPEAWLLCGRRGCESPLETEFQEGLGLGDDFITVCRNATRETSLPRLGVGCRRRLNTDPLSPVEN